MFPAHIRYSGISIGYAIGAILGGAFAATVAEVLLQKTGWSGSIALYIMALTVVSVAAVLWVGRRAGTTSTWRTSTTNLVRLAAEEAAGDR